MCTLYHIEQPISLFMEEESLETTDPFLFPGDDSDLLPPSAPSLCDHITQINFDAPPLHPEDLPRTISLSLFLDARPGCGGIAWPAGEVGPVGSSCHLFSSLLTRRPPNVRHLQVLAGYIARRGPALQGLNVLELGSGTGLVGLVAGCLGARVCITDQACVIFLSSPFWTLQLIVIQPFLQSHLLQTSYLDHGAQYLAQQIAIKR